MRASGILLPIASLPGPYGIGTLGKAAYQWIDFLQQAKQKYWQVLPIGPTGYGDSPYQSFSAFAANPYFIDLERLREQGLLTRAEIEEAQLTTAPHRIDYARQFSARLPLLKKAANRFQTAQNGYAEFVAQNAFWLPDYALFMALKEENQQRAFTKWPLSLRLRKAEVLRQARVRCAEQIRCRQVLQYWFYEQWTALKKYANDRNVFIIGDIPIYVSPDSSDLWTQPSLFQTDEKGDLTEVAGCPPDAFSANGQLWGNPLYRWEEHQRTGYQWWINRLRYAASVFDQVRIDHFRGFSGYYAVNAKAQTAANGHWCAGPGSEFVRSIKIALPDLKVIAEDLGYLTPDVRALLKESGFPGMKVLQFAFDSREDSDYLPHNYHRNCVVYTGTHDNTTAEDWQISAPAEDVRFAKEYIHADSGDFTRQFIRTAMASVGDTVIIPIQDWLQLGAEARINTPGTVGGNWTWRMLPSAASASLARQVAEMTCLYGRA